MTIDSVSLMEHKIKCQFCGHAMRAMTKLHDQLFKTLWKLKCTGCGVEFSEWIWK